MATAFAGVNIAFNELISLSKRAISSVVDFGKKSIQSFSHFQQLESSLQGLMRSEEKGTELFEHLRSFSFDTTFGVDTLASATQQLLGVGIAVEDLDSTLLMMGNVAQGDTQKFMELVSVFAKIQNMGKASSIQLQQLALRGVPIYQMLKQMGVEGTATGEDIKKAFEQMTGAGGQFENAMERINKTIQGKEGFVSDTWREFLTSFAEASGLADVYAKVLDVVYNALQGVVDWLQKINENPVYQAIFRGVVVTMIGAIGSALLLKLIPVIATLVKSVLALAGAMTTLNATNPFGWVALGVSAIAGLTVAYKSLNKEVKDYSDLELENQRRNNMEELQKKVKSGKATTQDKYDLASIQVAYWEKQLAGGFGDYGIDLNDEYEVLDAKNELKKWKQDLKEYRTRLSAQQVQAGIESGTLKAQEKAVEDDPVEQVFEKWQEILIEKLKLDPTKQSDIVASGKSAMEYYGKTLKDALYREIQNISLLADEGFITSEEQDTMINDARKKYNETIRKFMSDLFATGEFEATDNTMKELVLLLREFGYEMEDVKDVVEDVVKETISSLSDLREKYKKDGNVAGYYGVGLLQQTKAGNIINGVMEGAEMGGLWGGITGGIMSVIQSLDGFTRIINIANTLLEWILKPLNDLFNWIADLFGLDEEISDQKEKELQRLKELNSSYNDLIKAIETQNEYYLKMKQNLANETEKRLLNAKGVNDMILTPNGNFSTHPDDYIIATKNPNSLGSKVNITINNNAGVEVQTSQSQNGDVTNLILNISKKVASDFALGVNGWDSAVMTRNRRSAGTSFSR